MLESIPLREGRRLFGLDPEGYDDVRPGYPDWIFDALGDRGAIQNIAALEIGAGTGKATRRLLEGGARPLTIVEPDRRFEAMLRAIAASTATECRLVQDSFEEAGFPDRSFGLVAAATSFHWIEPISGLSKVRRLLASGGVAALFWNVLGDADKNDPFHEATKDLLSGLPSGPSGSPGGVPFALDRDVRLGEAKEAGFKKTDYLESRWSFSLTTAQVGKLYQTFSHIQRLDAHARAKLLDRLMEIAETRFRGKVTRNVTTCLYLFS